MSKLCEFCQCFSVYSLRNTEMFSDGCSIKFVNKKLSDLEKMSKPDSAIKLHFKK